MSKQIINFIGKQNLRSTKDVLSVADRTAAATGVAVADIEKLRQRDAEMNRMLRSSLSLLTTVQIARFAIQDIQQLASGKGGLTDILSLAMSSILLVSQLNILMKDTLLYQSIINAQLALSGLSDPAAMALAAGVTVAIGFGTLMSLGNWRTTELAKLDKENQLRLLAYRSVYG